MEYGKRFWTNRPVFYSHAVAADIHFYRVNINPRTSKGGGGGQMDRP